MKKKIVNYLASKNESNYSRLDSLFKLFIDETINKILLDYSLYDIRTRYQISKKYGNGLELNFKYYNIICTVQFHETYYEYIIYKFPNKMDDLEFEENIKKFDYTRDFSFEKFLTSVFEIMKNHPELKDNTKSRKIKKVLRIISIVLTLLPIVIFIPFLCIYMFNKETTLQIDDWVFIVAVAVPLILGMFFNILAKK